MKDALNAISFMPCCLLMLGTSQVVVALIAPAEHLSDLYPGVAVILAFAVLMPTTD